MLPRLDSKSVKKAAICLSILGSVAIFLLVHKQNSELEEYPVVTVDTNLEGKIINKDIIKSVVKIVLANGQKFTLPKSRNNSYTPPDLNNFIRVGDFVKKRRGIDTLIVLRGTDQYFFRLGQFLTGDAKRKERSWDISTFGRSNLVQRSVTPIWKHGDDKLVEKLRTESGAKEVTLHTPHFVTSTHLKFWLKVTLLNPEMADSSLDDFAKKVARLVLDDLVNNEQFERVEVVVSKKRGLILTFTSRKSIFVDLDSIR